MQMAVCVFDVRMFQWEPKLISKHNVR